MEKKPEKKSYLGDKWERWDGTVKPTDINAKTPAIVYSLLLLLSVAIAGGFTFFILYMISPRLSEWGSGASGIVSGIVFGIICALAVIYAVVQVSAAFGISFFSYFLYAMLPRVLTNGVPTLLGRMMRISEDRIGNSYVRFHNQMTSTRTMTVTPDKLLLLLPRCIKKERRDEIVALCNEIGCRYIVATGGEMARDKVREVAPQAVIAVACERDLVSGISEVMRKVAVIGVANTRPNGPCVLTEVDVAEIRRWIQHFLGDEDR